MNEHCLPHYTYHKLHITNTNTHTTHRLCVDLIKRTRLKKEKQQHELNLPRYVSTSNYLRVASEWQQLF